MTEKRPLNLRLDADLVARLKVHALRVGLTASEVVARWVAEHTEPFPVPEGGAR